MKTSLVFPIMLAAAGSIAACSGEGGDLGTAQEVGPSGPAARTEAVEKPTFTARSFTPVPTHDSTPIPLGASQYRVALVWGKTTPDRARPVLAEHWNIEASSAWGTVGVVATLPGESGVAPKVMQQTTGHVSFESGQDAGLQGAILSVVVAGVEPQVLYVAEGTSKDAIKISLGTIDDTPGGTIPLRNGGTLNYTGFTLAPACPRGFTLGIWGPDESGLATEGDLFGVLLTDNGGRLGWLNGTWKSGHANEPGSFKAQYVDFDDNKQGMLSGDWNAKSLEGNWQTHSHANGFVHAVRGGNGHAGGWLGTWSAICGL